jgi:hypothetical protein
MDPKIIENFVSLPDVLGLALIHNRSLLHLYLKRQILNVSEQKILSEKLFKAVSTFQGHSNTFALRLVGYYSYFYKVTPDYDLVIITEVDKPTIKLIAANQLKTTLQKNIEQAAQNRSLLSMDLARALTASGKLGFYYDRVDQQSTSSAPPDVDLNFQEILEALNALSQIVRELLGPTLTASYWRTARPKDMFLNIFDVDNSGKITCKYIPKDPITSAHQLHLREWTGGFMKLGCQIIKDLPKRVASHDINPKYKKILQLVPSNYESKAEHWSSDDSLF